MKRNENVLTILRDIRNSMLFNKEVWTIEDLAAYTGYEQSYIYKLCHERSIPFCKAPQGNKTFFEKDKIIEWLTTTQFNPELSITEFRKYLSKNKSILK